MFEQTKKLLETTDCTYLHVFPFSRRPGTRAAAFDDQVDQATKHRRVKILRQLSTQKQHSFYRRFLNSRRIALLETENLSDHSLKGYTDNYIPVVAAKPELLPVEPVTVELVELAGTSVLARIV